MSLPPLSPFQAVGTTLAVLLTLILSVSLLGVLFPSLVYSIALAGVLEVVIYTGVSYWLVRSLGRPSAILETLGMRSAPLAMLTSALLLGVVLHGPAGLLEWLGRQVFPVSDAVLRERALRLSPESLSERVLLALVVALLAPLVEELFFRGALHARLARATPLPVVTAVTTLCFTISHPEPRLWLALGSIGWVLGILRAVNAGILPCFLLHASFNATTLGVAFREPRNLEVAQTPNVWVGVIGTLLSVAIVAFVVRSTRTTPRRAA